MELGFSLSRAGAAVSPALGGPGLTQALTHQAATRLLLALAAAELEAAPRAVPRLVHPTHLGAAPHAALDLEHADESTVKSGCHRLLHSSARGGVAQLVRAAES